jgi:hypothetical protein
MAPTESLNFFPTRTRIQMIKRSRGWMGVLLDFWGEVQHRCSGEVRSRVYKDCLKAKEEFLKRNQAERGDAKITPGERWGSRMSRGKRVNNSNMMGRSNVAFA